MNKALSRARRPRRGYAMLTVLVFLSTMLTAVAISQRHVAIGLATERARLLAQDRDEGPLQAIAKALELLETGLPPANQYTCQTTVITSQGDRSFVVTFNLDPKRKRQWHIQVALADAAKPFQPMPASFAD